ncbi:hypothetical protein cyc_08579 [Cyclospora cayetanensis]|uniref:Chromo domain-containing protein n=1 Tax=Cyclospora cayetanensis TaxID=88456 RepID=A0A1D3DAY4_9EIME|nr:hypothetical protein cyc_08579 [Cyclospora cayetanensis]
MPSTKKLAGKAAGKPRNAKNTTYQVRDIRGYRIDNKVEKFFVLWLDYADEDSTWEPWSSLSDLGGELRKKMDALRDRYNESIKRLESLREGLATAREEASQAARSLADYATAPPVKSSQTSRSSSSGDVEVLRLEVSSPVSRGEETSYSEGGGKSVVVGALKAPGREGEREQTQALRQELLQRVGVSRIATRNLRCYVSNLERYSSAEVHSCALLSTQEWESYPKFVDWGTDAHGGLLLRLAYLQVNFTPVPFNVALLRRALSPDTRFAMSRKFLEALAEWQLSRLLGYDCVLMPNDDFLSRLDCSKKLLQHWQWMRKRLLPSGLLLQLRDPVKNAVFVAFRASREQLEDFLREMAEQRVSRKLKKAAASPETSAASRIVKEERYSQTPLQERQSQQPSNAASLIQETSQRQPTNSPYSASSRSPLEACVASCRSDSPPQQQKQADEDGVLLSEDKPRETRRKRMRCMQSGPEALLEDGESAVVKSSSNTGARPVPASADVVVAYAWLRAEEAAVTHALEVVKHAEETATSFAMGGHAPATSVTQSRSHSLTMETQPV